MRLVLVMVAVLGCAERMPASVQPETQVASVGALFAVPGESMVYDVALRGVPIARVLVGVGRLGWIDGHRAIIVRSRGHTEGLLSLIGDLTWDLNTTLDLEADHPIRDVEEARLVVQGHEEHGHHDREWSASDGFHDVHSAAARLRGWHARPNERTELDVTIDDVTLELAVWESGRELLRAPKSVAAVRYEGIAAAKYHFAVWISDDTARVPLRLRAESKWGAITIDLVDYEAPAE